jgi:inosine-uridine nucleoside N-ribohydrolase
MSNNSEIMLIVHGKPGVDDALALLLLLASPEIQIEAITVVFGQANFQNAFGGSKLISFAHYGMKEIPTLSKPTRMF